MQLRHDVVTAPGGAPSKAVLFLHGILGSGSNLRTVARRFVEARPAWAAVLVDLRAHGRSLSLRSGERVGVRGEPDTIQQAADDVLETVAALPFPVRAVVGHSLGGKISLHLVHRLPALEHVVSVDSNPGTRHEGRGPEATTEVVALLERLRGPWPARDAFLAGVEARGLSRPVAQWLAMNLERDGDAWRFRLELPRIRALLDSFFATDAWPVLEAAARSRSGPAVHLVVGESSRAFEAADRERAAALAASAPGQLTVDVVPAGHWVHVDAPDALHEVLLRRLPD